MRLVVKSMLVGAAALVAVLGGGAAWIAWPLPESVLARNGGQSVTIEDRNGLPLRAARAADGSQTAWMPYAQIDPDLINAFVAVEDRRFWKHAGVDWRGVARAARDNLRARTIVSGASTITMQLARLLEPAKRTW